MLTFDLDTDALARTRFAGSALHETIASLRVLADPAAHAMHLPWLREVAPRLAGTDLALLRALVPARGYVPDFVMPPPTTPLPDIESELARVLAADPAQVALEVAETFAPAAPPPVARVLVDDPPAGLARLHDQLRVYFAAALAPWWPTVGALLEADIVRRARQLADGGAHALFADLHPAVRWERGGRLVLEITYEAPVTLDGRGLLLMPSVFAWPSIFAVTDPPWQPTLIYPARGVASAWEPVAPPSPGALAGVLGATRARLLAVLEVPLAGRSLARALELTPGAVSQHIAALRAAGLVATHRDGRRVLCRRTELAERLLEAAGERP